jgi:hypothetical protein
MKISFSGRSSVNLHFLSLKVGTIKMGPSRKKCHFFKAPTLLILCALFMKIIC